MPGKKHGYKKLCRATGAEFGSAVSTRYALWEGEDHLLYIIKEGFSEHYRRFYYRDIQALVTHETVAGRITTICLSLISLFLLLLVTRGLIVGWHLAATVSVGILDACFLTGLLVNWLKGPTCNTYIYTAVQRERLHPLIRVGRARKVMDRIREKIEAVQGALTADAATELAARQAEMPTRAERTSIIRAAQKPKPETKPLKAYAGNSHRILFALLLAQLGYCYLRFLFRGDVMFFATMVLWGSILFALIVSIIKQHGTNLTAMLKGVTWLSLLYVFVQACISYAAYIIFAIVESSNAPTWVAAARQMADTSATESTPIFILLLFSCIGSGGLGLTGLILLNRFGRREQETGDKGQEEETLNIQHSTPNIKGLETQNSSTSTSTIASSSQTDN